MKYSPNILVLIANGRGRSFLGRCIASLDGYPCDIAVTTDQQGDNYPTKTIFLPSGIRPVMQNRLLEDAFARDPGYDAVLYLNDDIILDRNAVERMWETLEADNTIGQVGGSIRDMPANTGRPSGILLAYNPDPVFFIHANRHLERTDDVDYACGGCMMIRSSVLNDPRIMGHDPSFGANWSDIDLSWRIKAAGWSVVVNPDVTAAHDERGALSKFRSADRMRVSEARLFNKWGRIGLLCWDIWRNFPEFSKFDPLHEGHLDWLKNEVKAWAKVWR